MLELRISFLLIRHRPHFQNPLTKGCDAFLVHEASKNIVFMSKLNDMTAQEISFQTCVHVMTMKHLNVRAKKLQTVSVKRPLFTWILY